MKTLGFYNMENFWYNISISANLWFWSSEHFVQMVKCSMDHHKARWRTWSSGCTNVCGVHAARIKQMGNKPNTKKKCAWNYKPPLMSLLPYCTFLKRKLQFRGPDRTGQMCAVTCLFLSVRGNGRRKREGKKEEQREECRGVREEKMEKWEESCLSLMCALNVHMINDITLQNL